MKPPPNTPLAHPGLQSLSKRVSRCTRCGELVTATSHVGPRPSYCPDCRHRVQVLALLGSAATISRRLGDDEAGSRIAALRDELDSLPPRVARRNAYPPFLKPPTTPGPR